MVKVMVVDDHEIVREGLKAESWAVPLILACRRSLQRKRGDRKSPIGVL